jgi:hypothetical protein
MLAVPGKGEKNIALASGSSTYTSSPKMDAELSLNEELTLATVAPPISWKAPPRAACGQEGEGARVRN